MGLTRLALIRPLAILMLILGVVLMGAVAYFRLGVERLPNIDIPFVSVNVSYPGASPEDVEAHIVQPIEDALAGVPGAQTINANARQGSGSVSVQLVEGANTDQALIDVQRRVAAVQGQLPKDAGDPRIGKFDPNAFPIMNLVLTGGNSADLYQLANDVIQPKLLSLPGVADVNLNGGRQREIQIQLDLGKLVGYGISVDQINGALQRENISAPAGSITQGTTSLSVRSYSLFQKISDLENMVVTITKDGAPVYLRNVAAVKDTVKPRSNYLRFNGDETVGLSILKQSNANTLDVANNVRTAVENFKIALPEGTELVVSNDSSRFVRRSLDAVQFDLGLAVLLTGTVLILFLHTWRNTFIVLLAIPTSLISTFLVMYAMGFTLNLMSLMALAMTIGILVDDSIVVIENIHRHLRQGESPFDAALAGRSEIGLAAMAITLTDIVVYLPVAFMAGNIGQLFRQYGLTIATATIFSLLVSFTLTPMLASRWLSGHEEAPERRGWWRRFSDAWETNFDRIAWSYGRVLGLALRFRPVVLFIGLLAFSGSMAMLPLNIVGREYAPQEDDGQFQVSVDLPVGTRLDTTNEAAYQMESMLKDVPEVVNVFTRVNGNSADFTVEVEEKSKRQRPLDQILTQVRRFGQQIPEANVQTSVQNPLAGGRSFVSVAVLGDDYATLNQVAGQLAEVMRSSPGVAEVRNSFQAQQPERRFVIDRERAAALGVNATQASSTLRTMVQGNTVSRLQEEGQPSVDITVMSQNAQDLSIGALNNVPIASTRSGIVLLGQVTKVLPAQGPVSISRVDRKRSISLNATIAGRSIGDAARDLRANLATVPLPPGYRWDLRGTVQQLDQAFAALGTAMLLSAILIYMLLVALYESLLYPAAIMFALPVAGVGAMLGLWLTGNTINIFSGIGAIALMGLVAKNAILLVDYTNTLRTRGHERTKALIEAGQVRLRPIVMTSATVVAAMFPLALKLEAGAESRAPMAVVIIGGVISSTLLTLVLVPVMYSLLDDVQVLLTRKRIPTEFRWPWHHEKVDAVGVPAAAVTPAPEPTRSAALGAAPAREPVEYP